MGTLVTEIVGILTAGLTGIASGIASGLTALVTGIFLSGTGTTSDPYKLSVFGGVVVVFAGVALAIGLCRGVVYWVQSLGRSRV